MHIGVPIRAAREASGYSRSKLAEKVGVSARSIESYEVNGNVPPPDIVLAVSRICKVPWLTQKYCRWHCAIGKAYSYEVLNNVNIDPASVLLKLTGEMFEAQAVLQRMLELAVNKNSRSDFTDQEWQEFKKYLHEFLDVEHNVETLKISLGQWCDVSELVREHNDKCYKHGYIKKKPAEKRTNLKITYA